MASAATSCIFCKIIKNEIPSIKLHETPLTLAFLDIQPLSRYHSLVIPKHHGARLTDIPDESLTEILSVAKKIARATGAENYNVLQNNGRLAHQLVDHVHFHVIPKGSEEEGLGIGWPMKPGDTEELKKVGEELRSRM